MTKQEHSSRKPKGEQSELMPAREQQPTQNGPASLPSVSQNRSANAPPLSGSSYSVELYIEELVLHGLEASERYRIGEAIERELTRLFTEQGVPPAITQSGEIARADGGALEVPPGSNSETTGAQFAKAIYGGFGQ